MKYTDEILQKMKTFGGLSYPLEKIKSILEINDIQFDIDFYDPKSQIYKMYQTGIDIAKFNIDKKMYELAISGDIKALEKYEQRKKENEEIKEKEKNKFFNDLRK
jgi:hypothetical protein